jgi:hypothetical protein
LTYNKEFLPLSNRPSANASCPKSSMFIEREISDYPNDIVNAIADAEGFARGMSYEMFAADKKTINAGGYTNSPSGLPRPRQEIQADMKMADLSRAERMRTDWSYSRQASGRIRSTGTGD